MRGRIAAASVVAIAALVAATGFLHTHPGRAIWARATGAACPFASGGTASLEEQAAAERRLALRLRGKVAAKGYPALGFELSHTTRDSFVAWARHAGVKCLTSSKSLQVECGNIVLDALPGAGVSGQGTLIGTFDLQQNMRSLSLVARVKDADAAAASLQAAAQAIAAGAGEASQRRGDATAAYLAKAPLSQAAAEFRFSDYYAKVNATNMGALGYYSITHTYTLL